MIHQRKTIAEINLKALAHNFHAIKSLLKPHTKFLAAVKANAYGHGAVGVAQELERLGVDMFGVACLYEVVELRNAGIKTPILNMAATFADEAESVVEYNYEATIFSLDIATKISDAALAQNKNAKIHIKVETGMNRIGVAVEDVLKLVREIKKLPNIEIVGLFTHFADADSSSSETTNEQLKIFNELLQKLEKAQIKIPLIHAANSAGALLYKESHFDMVRVGMSLYGYFSADDKNIQLPVKLEPVMSLKSYVSHVKIVPTNTPISYGGTYRTTKPAIIATLACGYADGVRRTPQNWGEVLCKGQRMPIVGRVCMDQMMIDASDASHIKVGDEVVLIGKQEGDEIDGWDVARRARTSVYEVLTAISQRVGRVFN